MMSFPWSYSILGLVPGLILTVFVAGVVLYTSLIIWYVALRGRVVVRFNIDSRSGDSVCVIPMSVTCVTLGSISFGTRRSRGTSLP